MREDKREAVTPLKVASENCIWISNNKMKSVNQKPPITSFSVNSSSLLFIMYTSGTTGQPKGVMHSHRSFFWSILNIEATARFSQQDVSLVCLPLFHVGALTPTIANIYLGCKSVLMASFLPDSVWNVINQYRVTTSNMVPTMLIMMLSNIPKDHTSFSSLTTLFCGSAPVPESLINSFKDKRITVNQVYGLTETGGPGCLLNGEEANSYVGFCGRPYFFTQVKIVDMSSKEVQQGKVGEICFLGPHLMEGYWNNPAETNNTMMNGWLHTGDIGLINEMGMVRVVDRKKDMIISGGENIYPAELENHLLKHPQIKQASVVGMPSEKWGESPVAFIVKENTKLHQDEIIAHCKGQLADFKIPKKVCFVDEFPLTQTGKVQKQILRAMIPNN